jgi:hypothetical protein
MATFTAGAAATTEQRTGDRFSAESERVVVWYSHTSTHEDNALSAGYLEGYAVGYADGEAAHEGDYTNGFAAGEIAGYATGYNDGYNDGLAAFPVDETPPTVDAVTPEGEIDPDFDVATATPIEIDIEDETDIATIVVHCTTSTSGGALCVFRRGAFVFPFNAFSFTSVELGATRLHIRHNDGWPPGSVNITTDVVDGGGNLDT